MDKYNYIDVDKAQTKRCVHPWGDEMKFGSFVQCEGDNCMGWVHELDASGEPTGRGRCGMVFPVLQSCTCSVDEWP